MSLRPSPCLSPSKLNNVSMSDGLKGLHTQSAYQSARHHWHNVKLWRWQWRARWRDMQNRALTPNVQDNCRNLYDHYTIIFFFENNYFFYLFNLPLLSTPLYTSLNSLSCSLSSCFSSSGSLWAFIISCIKSSRVCKEFINFMRTRISATRILLALDSVRDWNWAGHNRWVNRLCPIRCLTSESAVSNTSVLLFTWFGHGRFIRRLWNLSLKH